MDTINFYRIVDLSVIERARATYFEHYHILEAIRTRDVDQSKALMEQHIDIAKNLF